MKVPFNTRIARMNLLSTSLIIVIFTVCLVLLLYVTQTKNLTSHVGHLRDGLVQAKSDFIKNSVYRTIGEIDNERQKCRQEVQSLDTGIDQTQMQLLQYCSEKKIKERVKERIRNTFLIDDGYIWVNEVLNYDGGDAYAIRLVHPNLIESEGSFLSTKMEDIEGNTPYKTELEGVKQFGEVFFSYWFKKKSSDKVSEKLTFAKLYKDFNWIIASGVYLDDIDSVVEQALAAVQSEFKKTLVLALLFGMFTAIAAFFIAMFFHRRIRATINGYIEESKDKESAIVTMNQNLEAIVRERTRKIVDSEQKLRESEEKYQDLYDNAPDMFASVDAETGCVIRCNRTLCNAIGKGKKDIIGKTVFELYHADSRLDANDVFVTFRDTGKVIDKNMSLVRSDGTKLAVSLNALAVRDEAGNVLYSRSSWRDVTDIKKMESELRQSQKMEAVGTLAGGIAHDFNNILASILGYTELALEEIDEGSQLANNLQEVMAAGNRAKGLVKQILTFARQTEEDVCPLNIAPIAKELIAFIRSSIPTTISIESSIESNSLVMANPSQIHQVLMNLCTNSAHAMEEGGGRLRLQIKDVTITSDSEALKNGMEPGEYVQICVSDTGTGIKTENLQSIFEPYFTTKEVGKGTGIGLAVVHGIIQGCNGFIDVNSTVGRGTTFEIYFPITKTAEEVASTGKKPIPGGDETILVVDDEAPLAEMLKRVLEQLGYTVIVCTDSLEALRLFRSEPQNIDALVTDMTMPGLTGDKLTKACQKLKPDLISLVCTGYSEIVSPRSATEMGVLAVIQKPIIKGELARVLRDGLDNRDGEPVRE